MFSGDETHGDDMTSPEMPRPRYPLDEACPDCLAQPGEPCHPDCSTNWT
jgi:hypothetical protein